MSLWAILIQKYDKMSNLAYKPTYLGSSDHSYHGNHVFKIIQSRQVIINK